MCFVFHGGKLIAITFGDENHCVAVGLLTEYDTAGYVRSSDNLFRLERW